jgi:hypothetical protein
VAQDAARRKSRVLRAQRAAPQQAPLAQKSQLGPAQLASLPGLLGLALTLVALQVRASPPRPPLGVLQPEQPYAQEPRALQPLQVEREWQPEPERQL